MPIETSYNCLRQGVAARVKESISEAGLLLWSDWGTLGAGKNRRSALPLGLMGNESRPQRWPGACTGAALHTATRQRE